MDKGVGFDRNIRLSWLDAVAALVTETDDVKEIRARLDAMLGGEIVGQASRRKTIGVLVGIWVRSGERAPELHRAAVGMFGSVAPGDRLWLHHGLTLLAYPFFRDAAAVIGQLARQRDVVVPALVRQRLAAERGQLGTLLNAVERVMFSLRDWGVLVPADGERFAYRPIQPAIGTGEADLETWLLSCALRAHPADELPFADLVRLPELFPFRFTVAVDQLRQSPRFAVQRQGIGWDMVRVMA